MAINKVKNMQEIQEQVLMRMIAVPPSVLAELAKAYAMLDAQIVSRKEKEMEWDD